MGILDGSGMPARFPPACPQHTATGKRRDGREDPGTLSALRGTDAARVADRATDVYFACTAYNLAGAYADKTRRCILSVPPAVHRMDRSYYFYINRQYTPVPNPEAAFEFEDRLIRFVNGGDRSWPVYGGAETLFNTTAEGFGRTKLPAQFEKRCKVVTAGLIDPANGVV
ncbi:hypothetical protein VTK56DRAFT_771 [Thermocarpiscus australiensis]